MFGGLFFSFLTSSLVGFGMFDSVRSQLASVVKQKPQPRHLLAVFVDGPNMLRKELGIELKEIKEALFKVGKFKIAKVFLNQFANNRLVEAVANQGFEPVITVGDVDVAMAAEATEAIFSPNVHAIVLVTRDADFLPVIVKAKRYGKETVVVLAEESSAAALKNTADQIIVLNGGGR